jgi:hypothetical protein
VRSVRIVALAVLLAAALGGGTAIAMGVGSFTPAAPMVTARGYFATAQLQNGNVLVAGGFDGAILGPPFFANAEIYHRHTGNWTAIPSMHFVRSAEAAVTLPNGSVLVAGGIAAGAPPKVAEIYNPKTNSWTDTGALTVPRFEDMAVALLPGGRVLIAGGFLPSAPPAPSIPLDSTEIWNPHTGTWSPGSNMHEARGEFASVTLKDGRVLVAGGVDIAGAALKTVEIYNPSTGHWSYTSSMKNARRDAAAVVLQDGRVLMAGGAGSSGQPIVGSEIYNPRTGEWKSTGELNVPRSEAEYAIVLLTDGKVLLTGGYNHLDVLDSFGNIVSPETDVNSAEVYNPKTGRWALTSNTMSVARSGHAAVLLPGDRHGVLVIGGAMGPATTSSDLFHW